MSSSICQELQSCLEPLLMEPRVRLALPPQIPPSFPHPARTQPLPTPATQITAAQACETRSVYPVTCQYDQAYIHPLIRSSSSVLSEKSLEMCTESLGSENGSDKFLWNEDEEEKLQMYPFFLTPSSQHHQCPSDGELPGPKSRKCQRGSGRGGLCDFPPPLKSMSGSAMVHMRPCRDGGRLVVQAVSMSSRHNFFRVERGGGRLRLSLLHDEEAGIEETEEDKEDVEEEEEHEEEEEESYETGKEEGKVGSLRRPSRCKDEKGLLTWKPCWVAT